MSKRVVVVKKSAVPSKRVVRNPRKIGGHPLNVPVNVKVAGERTVMKHVTLAALPERRDAVKVLTGHRGRPAILPLDVIERVRVL